MSAKTAEERAQSGAYIGSCAKCGKMVAACADDPADKAMVRDNAKFVASLVRRGFRVSHTTVAEVRVAPWCDCARKGESR